MQSVLKVSAYVSLFAAFTFLGACKSGYNRIYENSEPGDEFAPKCVNQPIDKNASAATTSVFKLIADITCQRIKGYSLVGQSVGHGDEISDTDNSYRSYQSLIETPATTYGKRIAIASVEYEKSSQFDEAALLSANTQLKYHSDKSGIVSVTWTPQNPWTYNNTDVDDKLARSDDTDISKLYGAELASSAQLAFDSQLQLVALMLKKLSDDNVPVLFTPLPEQNTFARWYGPHEETSEKEYKNLWKHIYDEINRRELNNILWVYAPLTSGKSSEREDATWGYASEYVDIVASISFSDELSVKDYSTFINLGKPMGLTLFRSTQSDGKFDNTELISELSSRYPYIAYWIADHDTQINTGDLKYSLSSNENIMELLNNKKTATVETIIENEWLSK